EFLDCSNNLKALFVNRTPIFDQKNCITGVFIQFIDASDVPQFNPYLSILKKDKKLIETDKQQIIYILSDSHFNFQLTEKQKICLFYLLRGKTAKEIAKILRLAPKTIESRVEHLKNKMGCHYKSELIDKALENGLLYYIPKNCVAHGNL